MSFGLAETAKLAVDLSLKGNFSSALAANQKALGKFNSAITDTQGRAYKAGQQIGTGIKRGAFIAIAAVGALIPLLISMAKEGQTAANVQAIFAKAISNSGKVTAINVAALKKQQQALLELAGVDDELIKTEQTRLIQMGLTGDQVLKLTPLILDFAKATGIDLLTATKLAGKAVQGNTGALSRYGVSIDKAKAKTDPFAATVDALNKKFGGTSQVLSGSLNTRLDVLREKLANIREEAGIKLLPVFTKIVDVVGAKLVPAFGKLIDAILPRAIAGLNKFADFLDRGGGADSVMRIVDTIQSLLPAIESGAKITGQVIGTAVHLFQSLPPEIQSLAVAGLAVNKLTGGLVTNIAGGLISAVISSFKGMMNVNAAVVNVNGAIGGIPGVGGAVAGAAAGAGGLGVGTILAGVAAGTAVAALGIMGLGWLINATSSQAQIDQTAQNVIDQNRFKRSGGTATPIARGGSLEDRDLRDLNRAMTGTESHTGKMADDIAAIPGTLRAARESFHSDLWTLIHATKALDVQKAAKKIGDEIGKGIGNQSNTQAVLKALQTQLLHTTDEKTRAVLKAQIARVEHVLPDRQFAARQYSAVAGILKDGKITASESKKLHSIMQVVKDRGLPAVTRGISAKVDAARKAQVAAEHAVKAAVAAVKAATDRSTQATKDQDLSVAINNTTNVSIRDIARATARSNSFARIAT